MRDEAYCMYVSVSQIKLPSIASDIVNMMMCLRTLCSYPCKPSAMADIIDAFITVHSTDPLQHELEWQYGWVCQW